ncbi:TetR/AcrR family transcriptional regulator [bacterium]|nr:TetR/AcrR family transcriptional regulator [bacterium]MBU1638027.1 TetR/AcrR family transcriptional regulator [bacterium]MBU1920482.1 TetR/AcrR family transcriptional regulator [bacterium]
MDKQTHIIKTAQKLFSQFGLKKVTTDDIAREARISKTTLYKFYRNKEDVFQDVVELETNQMIARITESVDAQDSVESKLKAFLNAKISSIHNLINFYRVTHDSWNEHWPFISEIHDRFLNEEKRILLAILTEGNRSGELAIDNAVLHAHILAISLKSIEFPWAVPDNHVSISTIVNLIIDTFLNGVRKRV